jgi:hypothetical protein
MVLAFLAIFGVVKGITAALIPGSRNFATNKLKELKNNILYNGIIRVIQVSFMSTCIIGVGNVLEILLRGEEELQTKEMVKCFVIFGGALTIITWSFHVLVTKRKDLEK